MQGWSNPNVRWSIHPDHSANGNFVNSTLPTGQQLVPGTQTQVLGGPQQNLPSHVVVPGLHTGTHGPQHQQLQAYPVMATTGASVLMSHPERSGPSTTNGGPPGNAPMHPYLTGTSFPFSHAALSSGIAQAPPVGSPALLNNAGGAVGVTPAQFTPSNTASSTNHLPIPTPPSHKLALPSSMLTNATPGQPPTAYLTSPKGDNTTGMGSSPAPGNSAQMLPQSNGLLQFPLNIAQLPAAQSAELFQQLSKLYNVGESTPGPYDTHTTPSGKDCAEEDSNDGDLCIEFDSSETPHIQEPPAAVPPSVGINPNQMSMESHGVSLSPAPPQRHSSLNTGVSFERISSSPLFHMPNTHNIPSSDVTHTPQSMTLPSSSPIVQSTPNLLSSTDVPGHAQTPAEQAAPAVAFIPEISDPVIDIPTKEPQDRTDSDLVPSDSQADPGSAGSKRGRVTFTEAQTITLDCVFHRRPYPTPAIRQALATRLNLSELQVNAWFVRRRAKSKASGSNPPAEGINRIALNKEDPGPGSFPYPVSAEVRNLVHEILDHKAPSNSPVPLHTPPVSSLPQPSTTTPSSSVQLSQQSKVAPATPNPPDKRLIVRLKMRPSPSGQANESTWVAVSSSTSSQSTPTLPASSGGVSSATSTSSLSLADLEELLQKTPRDTSKLPSLIKGMFACMQEIRLPVEQQRCQKLLMNVKDTKTLHAIAESKIPALLRVWLWKGVERDENSEEIPRMLKTIQHLPMTVARLRKSLLGRVVRTITLRKSIQNEQTRQLAKQLLEEWQHLPTLENKKPVSNPPRTISYSMSHLKKGKLPLKPRTAIDDSDLAFDRIRLHHYPQLDPHPVVVFDCVEIPYKKSPVDIKQLVKQRTMGNPLRFDPFEEEMIPRRRKAPVKNAVIPSKASVSRLREYRQMFTKGGGQKPGGAVPTKRSKSTRSSGPNMLDDLLLSMTGGKTRNLGHIPKSIKPTPPVAPSSVASNGEGAESGMVAKRIADRLAQQHAKDPMERMSKPRSRPIDNADSKPSTMDSTATDSSADYPWPQTTSATLAPLRRKTKKDGGRRVTFAPDNALTKVKKFYASHPADFSTPTWATEEPEQSTDAHLDFDNGDAWTVGLPHEFGNARDLDRQEGRLAFKQPRVTISESVTWAEPRPIAFDSVANPALTKAIMWRGKNSTERDVQRNRERRVLSVNYIHNDKIPPAPISPVVPSRQPEGQELATEPRIMPFGTPDEIPPQPAVANNNMTQSLSHLMQELGQGGGSQPSVASGLPPTPAVPQVPTGVSATGGQQPSTLDLGALLSNASAMLSNPQGLATFLSTMAMTNNLMANQSRDNGNPLANLLSNPLLANTQALLPLLQSLGSMGATPAAPPMTSQPPAASPTYSTGDKRDAWGSRGDTPSDRTVNRGPPGRPSKKHKFSPSPPPWGPPDESNDGWGSQPTSGWNNRESDWSVPPGSVSPPQDDYHSRRPKGGRGKKNVPCRFYHTHKGCFRGDSCPFSHEHPPSS